MFTRIFRPLLKFSKYFLFFLFSYLALTLICSYIPYNTSFEQAKKDSVRIYLHSNGVHTDIVMPARSSHYNWSLLIPHLTPKHTFVSIGWGDKGFYLNTPTWGELKFSTAFKAAFWLSTTAIHVTPLQHEPAVSDHTVAIDISQEQYKTLCAHVKGSFLFNEKGALTVLHHDPRYYSGSFYDAVGTYSILTSCNSWVNKSLKVSGIRTCLWTPFEWPLLRPFRK